MTGIGKADTKSPLTFEDLNVLACIRCHQHPPRGIMALRQAQMLCEVSEPLRSQPREAAEGESAAVFVKAKRLIKPVYGKASEPSRGGLKVSHLRYAI